MPETIILFQDLVWVRKEFMNRGLITSPELKDSTHDGTSCENLYTVILLDDENGFVRVRPPRLIETGIS
jgi:hypothetical protein